MFAPACTQTWASIHKRKKPPFQNKSITTELHVWHKCVFIYVLVSHWPHAGWTGMTAHRPENAQVCCRIWILSKYFYPIPAYPQNPCYTNVLFFLTHAQKHSEWKLSANMTTVDVRALPSLQICPLLFNTSYDIIDYVKCLTEVTVGVADYSEECSPQ